MVNRCDILIPPLLVGDKIAPGNGSCTCLLPHGHTGPHLMIDRLGTYWYWERDHECDCQQSGELYCDCFVYWKVEDNEARELLRA